MQITYEGHSCFKLKGKQGTVVMDPFSEEIGLPLGRMTADIVTISHHHFDHNNLEKVKGSEGRGEAGPLVIDAAGAYESGGVSVFGVRTWHDAAEGADRGANIVFTVYIDGLNVCHLGDLGQVLTPEQVAEIGEIDVLMMPVGGTFTIGPKEAIEVAKMLNPAFVIPMHYRTPLHKVENFGDLVTLEAFLNEYGMAPEAVAKLDVDKARLPEETELVVMSKEA